ncbi:sugar phosphate isomerase/epimerase family protein [Frondihabitans australicus]|uniref:Sugar phosphate isomerase/epimerase n=1 Tax=Frondihabitans australicus TaxID=386892 RepID=A0A495IFB8_9MICO|nr:sugar phosphate isomerase/epimerase family protein [Frondihabitans australicus]RKR74350.1 sugar phosphate isomerase/epimerase [Frondihabitans australicus]
MRFSVFTASTPEWTPAEVVANLKEQGWDGVEWRVVDQPAAAPSSDGTAAVGFWAGNRATWPLTGLEESVPEILRLTREAGLGMSGIGGYAQASDHENVERMLAATAALGAGQVRVTMPRTDTGEDYPSVFARTRADLEWVVSRAAEHGVKALVELHHETITPSASAARRLLEGLDPAHVGAIHDLGNLVNEGFENHRAAFELLGDYLAHVHVKNARWVTDGSRRDDGSLVWRHEWATLRDGQADVGRYLTDLREHGYDGWVTLEDFSTDLPLADRTRDNLAWLHSLVGANA